MTQAHGDPSREQFERETLELLREIRSQLRWLGFFLLGLPALLILVGIGVSVTNH